MAPSSHKDSYQNHTILLLITPEDTYHHSNMWCLDTEHIRK